jgi:soluble lytic murein transglycosylase
MCLISFKTNAYSSKKIKYNSRDVKASKFLEEFYSAFKNEKYKKVIKSYNRFVKIKSIYSHHIPILRHGKKTAQRILRNRNCWEVSRNTPKSSFQKRFLDLYISKCEKHLKSRIVKSSRSILTKNEKAFLSVNKCLFKDRYFSVKFNQRYKTLKNKDKAFISSLIKKYIMENDSLTLKNTLNFLIPDEEITQFIQSKQLFDKHSNKYYHSTLKKLLSQFEEHYIDDEEDKAALLLTEIKSFYQLNKKHISDAKLWVKLIKSGQKLTKNENYEHALDFFHTSKSFANTDDRNKSSFHILFTHYLKNEVQEARAYIQKERIIERFSSIDSRLMYWTAFILDLNKELKQSKELYMKTITDHPISFYSILSLKRLQQISPIIASELMLHDDESTLGSLKLTKKSKRRVTEYYVHIKANSQRLLAIQASSLRKDSAKDFFTTKLSNKNLIQQKSLYLIDLFSQTKMFLQSFKEAYQKINSNQIRVTKSVITSLFPNSFSKYVKRSNKVIDHRIVLSLIRQESGFNKQARSPAGARGLMQIMPKTGKYMKKGLKTRDLYNPRINIKLGSKYLKYLLRKYKGNLMFTLAAYNAGEGNVRKWRKKIPFTNDIISDIELIPFEETKKYVKLIYRNLFFYRLADGDKKMLQETPEQTFLVNGFI